MTGRQHRARRWAATACVLLVLIFAGGLPVYVRPQVDPLRHADAVFVLGGAYYERYPFGIALGEDGWAPVVVMSNPHAPEDPALARLCVAPHPGVEVDCFVPDPPTTLGEGRELRRRAEQFGWRQVIVVTFTPHISRARFILDRCFDGALIMVASPAEMSLPGWIFEYGYQTAGFVKAALHVGC